MQRYIIMMRNPNKKSKKYVNKGMTITATPIVFLDSESDVVISCVPSVASGKAERSELSDFWDEDGEEHIVPGTV